MKPRFLQEMPEHDYRGLGNAFVLPLNLAPIVSVFGNHPTKVLIAPADWGSMAMRANIAAARIRVANCLRQARE